VHQPLQSHIVYLEDELQELFEAVTSRDQTPLQRRQFEAQIQLLNYALDRYRFACRCKFGLIGHGMAVLSWMLRPGQQAILQHQFFCQVGADFPVAPPVVYRN
jgi:hypothetical protein